MHTHASTYFYDQLGEQRISQVHCISLSTCDILKLRWHSNWRILDYPVQILVSRASKLSPTISRITKLNWSKDYTVNPYRLLISLCTLHLNCSIADQNQPIIFTISSKRNIPHQAQHSVRVSKILLLDRGFHPARNTMLLGALTLTSMNYINTI